MFLKVIFFVSNESVAVVSSQVLGLNRFSGYGWNATCQSKLPPTVTRVFNVSTKYRPGMP